MRFCQRSLRHPFPRRSFTAISRRGIFASTTAASPHSTGNTPQLDGLPYLDETHYRLQVGYLLDNWNLERALLMLEHMQRRNDLGLSPVQMKAIQAIYLIENLARLFAEGYDAADNDMVGWYCQLLHKLSPARKEMVAA